MPDVSLFECVPNFSEGRRAEVIESILDAIRGTSDVRLIDTSRDPDHNRSVATFVGGGEAVSEAAFRAMERAAETIDLSRHTGEHPRMGATDVCPFVPLAGASMSACVALAHRLGERAGSELAIPIFFYGEAALRPDRRSLPDVRRGGFELLREAIGSDPARAPDAGPAHIHPKAGATAVGARGFLIAFNVELETRDVEVARGVARDVRESSGGLPALRALGIELVSRGCTQVSMNLCDYRRTGLVAAFDAVRGAARRRGVGVRRSELVGLAPSAALDARIAEHVQLHDFEARRCILEERLG
jgi:glutamate formiminotransferase